MASMYSSLFLNFDSSPTQERSESARDDDDDDEHQIVMKG